MEWQEALGRKGLKVNVKKTEVVVCTREVRVEADLSDKKKGKGVFLYSAVSSPFDRSKCFTLHP